MGSNLEKTVVLWRMTAKRRSIETDLKTIYSENNWVYNFTSLEITYCVFDIGYCCFIGEINPDSEWFWTPETKLELEKGLGQFYNLIKLDMCKNLNKVYIEIVNKNEEIF